MGSLVARGLIARVSTLKGGCGGMVCGKVSQHHRMFDRWDNVLGPSS